MTNIVTRTHPPIKQRALKVINSRLTVILALILMCIGLGSSTIKSKAADTGFSTAYQYYLLDNEGGGGQETDKDTGTTKLINKAVQGILGNGGNKITFTYNDIINGAENPSAAKKFARTMATLSAYNYVSTQSSGMLSGLIDVGRAILGWFILLPLGLFMDLVQGISSFAVKLLAQLNISTILGNRFMNSGTSSELAKSLNLSQDTFNTWSKILFSMGSVVLLATVIWALRRGADKIDQGAMTKVRGRIMGLIFLPTAFILTASILSDVQDITNSQSGNTQSVFAKYIINNEAWAEKYNFNMQAGGAKGIGDGDMDGFVDTDYNPYGSNNAASKIGGAIENATTDNQIFKNSALAFEFGSSTTFNARDYLASIENGENKGNVRTLKNIQNQWSTDDIYKINSDDQQRAATTGQIVDRYGKFSKDDAVTAAADDYVKDKKAVSKNGDGSWMKTWEARYIYGAKNTGNIKKYYGAKPSVEQIYNNAGGNSDTQLSYESTFLVLSTRFTPTGGSLMLDGPSYGAAASIANFASQRVEYYQVAMVGTPIITTLAILRDSLIYVIVGLAGILAVWQMGIIDMNLKPFRSWIKTAIMGDQEYLLASLVYGLGLVGAYITLNLFPNILVDTGTAINNAIAGALGATVDTGNYTVGSYLVVGIPLIVEGGFMLAFFIMFMKNIGGIRDKLVELLTLPWVWASLKGGQLEATAAGSAAVLGKKAKEYFEGKNNKRKEMLMDLASGGGKNKLLGNIDKFTGGKASQIGKELLKAGVRTGAFDMGGTRDGNGTKLQNDLAKVEQLGTNSRINNAQNNLKEALNNVPTGNVDPSKEFALQPEQMLNNEANSGIKSLDEIKEEALANGDDATAQAINNLSPEDAKRFNDYQQKDADLAAKESEIDNKLAELNKVDPETLSPEERQKLEEAKKDLQTQKANIQQQRINNRRHLARFAQNVGIAADKLGIHPSSIKSLDEIKKEAQALGDISTVNNINALTPEQAQQYADLAAKDADLDKQGQEVDNKLSNLEQTDREGLTPEQQQQLDEDKEKLQNQKADIAQQRLANRRQLKELADNIGIPSSKLIAHQGSIKSLDALKAEAQATGDTGTLNSLNSLTPNEVKRYNGFSAKDAELNKQAQNLNKQIADLDKLDRNTLSPEELQKLDNAKKNLVGQRTNIQQQRSANLENFNKFAENLNNPEAKMARADNARQNLTTDIRTAQAKLQDFKTSKTPATKQTAIKAIQKLQADGQTLGVDVTQMLGTDADQLTHDLESTPIDASQMGRFAQADIDGNGTGDVLANRFGGQGKRSQVINPSFDSINSQHFMGESPDDLQGMNIPPRTVQPVQTTQSFNRSVSTNVPKKAIITHSFDRDYMRKMDEQVKQAIKDNNRQGAEKLMERQRQYLKSLDEKGRFEAKQAEQSIKKKLNLRYRQISRMKFKK